MLIQEISFLMMQHVIQQNHLLFSVFHLAAFAVFAVFAVFAALAVDIDIADNVVAVDNDVLLDSVDIVGIADVDILPVVHVFYFACHFLFATLLIIFYFHFES